MVLAAGRYFGFFWRRSCSVSGRRFGCSTIWTWTKSPFLIMGDAEGYWDLGGQIAAGKPYELYHRNVLRMPGYPAFVAGAIRLAELLGIPDKDHLVARLLMAGVGTLACGLVALLGRLLFDGPTGTLAAAITAIAPPLVGFSAILLSETLFAATLLASLYCMARLVFAATRGDSRPRLAAWAAMAGAAIGLAVYVRPSWLLVAPCFAVLFAAWLSTRRPLLECVGAAAIVVACAYGTLIPWAYRNFDVTGHWIWTTLWVGASLYDGFNPQASGDSNMQFFEQDRLMDRMTEYDVDRHYRQKAWQYVRDQPGRAVRLTFAKLLRFWMPWPNAEQFSGWGPRLMVAAYFIPALLAAVLGLIFGPRNFWGWALAWDRSSISRRFTPCFSARCVIGSPQNIRCASRRRSAFNKSANGCRPGRVIVDESLSLVRVVEP